MDDNRQEVTQRPKLFKTRGTWYCKLGSTTGRGPTPRQAFTHFKYNYHGAPALVVDDLLLIK